MSDADLIPLRTRKTLRREDVDRLRSLIGGAQLIDDLLRISAALQAGYETVRQTDGDAVQLPVGRERTSSLKAAADIKLKLLGKVLPDLSATQITGPEDGPLEVIVRREEEGL